jgi:tRNA (cytidine/uridine-2'-O-)-methyltransferase
MPLHIALLDPVPADITGGVARQCAASDASLHLIGPLQFASDDTAFRKAGPSDWDVLDWWLHPGWRAFRDAMSRERCIYFSADSERDPAEAPFRANSVLVLGDAELALPERIREKYPERVFRVPRIAGKLPTDLPNATKALLSFAAKRVSDAPSEPTTSAKSAKSAGKPARRRRR